MSDWKARYDSKEAALEAEVREDLEAHPPGSLGLPPLLDQARIEYGIPSCYFEMEYVGDHCMVMQLDTGGGDTWLNGGAILKPDTLREAEKRGNFIGILVAAGTDALDYLQPRKVELGHKVLFVRNAPYHPELGRSDTGDVFTGVDLVCHDIRGSYNLGAQRISGKLRLARRDIEINGLPAVEHYYEEQD